MAGVRAFREAFMSAGEQGDATFESWDARSTRYSILWSMFENTSYRNVHAWSQSMKVQYGLYRHIRNIYNPAHRLGGFWQTHLLGGILDPAAGDGGEVPSAIPIVTDNEAHRTAIAQTWAWSNWDVRKDIFSLWGSTLGDVLLKPVDDPTRKKVSLQIVHPATVSELTLDDLGNVKGYVIEESRDDPRPNSTGRSVTYTETAWRDGDAVMYRTDLDGTPYAWIGDQSEWSEPYGFVPLVHCQHNNVGIGWGWAEIYPVFSKAREVDDQASKLSDQVRKSVDAPWLFSGVTNPKTQPKTTATQPTGDRPEPGREEIPALYGPPGATATPLVAPLDIVGVGANIDRLLAELERDLPELQHDIWSAGGDASGRALRISRQRVEEKVQMRRINYDGAMKRALQMAISIGGLRGYEGFAGFNLDSFKAGDLDFEIGVRDVFKSDPMDVIAEEQAFWLAAKTAIQTGIPLKVYLRRQGWSEKDVAEVVTSPEYQAWVAGQGLG